MNPLRNSRNLLAILFATLLTLGVSANAKDSWWNSAWTARKPITIDTTTSGAAIGEPIGSATVLVRLFGRRLPGHGEGRPGRSAIHCRRWQDRADASRREDGSAARRGLCLGEAARGEAECEDDLLALLRVERHQRHQGGGRERQLRCGCGGSVSFRRGRGRHPRGFDQERQCRRHGWRQVRWLGDRQRDQFQWQESDLHRGVAVAAMDGQCAGDDFAVGAAHRAAGKRDPEPARRRAVVRAGHGKGRAVRGNLRPARRGCASAGGPVGASRGRLRGREDHAVCERRAGRDARQRGSRT